MTLVAAVFVWTIYFFPKDPLIYWKGIQAVNRDRGAQPYFYLMGTLKPGGWKSYLLVAWLVKTPIPSLLTVAAVVMSFRDGGQRGLTKFSLSFLPQVTSSSSLFADNIGVRYLFHASRSYTSLQAGLCTGCVPPDGFTDSCSVHCSPGI
jgi:hypothetical protein